MFELIMRLRAADNDAEVSISMHLGNARYSATRVSAGSPITARTRAVAARD
jgi:hypothetical protein